MDMRLEQREIRPEQPCGRCTAQFNVDGDVTLPGSLRETAHILHVSAMAVAESAEAMQDRASVAGRVVFRVLYTQGERKQPTSIEATADFNHLCDLPGALPRTEVFACVQVEHAEAAVQGGRMNLRAVVRLWARAMGNEPLAVITQVDAPGVQQRTEQLRLRTTVGRGSADVLLREEFSLPAELAVQETLGAGAQAVFFDTAGGQGRIGLSGEVTIEAVHASSIPGKPIVVTRHSLPVSQSVEITGENGELLDGRIVVKDVAVASQDMGDGERTLRAEVLLGLTAWAEREETAALLADAYTTEGEALQLHRRNAVMRTGARRMQAAESGKVTLMLPGDEKPLRTVLAAFAVPVMTGFTQQGSRLIAEGVMEATLLYLSEDGETPLSVRLEAPFRTAFAAEAAPEDIVTLQAANVEAVLITSDRAELRYILRAEVEGVQAAPVTVIDDVTAIPAEPTETGIVLCYAQPGETLWEIARRYRLPEAELRKLNPELQEQPKAGQGVLVWRRSSL